MCPVGVHEGRQRSELSLKRTVWPEGARLSAHVCVGSMCDASVAFICVCVCVPCGSRGQAEGIRLTDVSVTLNAGAQTRYFLFL